MKKPLWRVRVEDIPLDGMTLEADSGDPKLLEVLEEVSEGRTATAGFVSLQVQPWPQRVDVTGKLEGRVPMVCARCLEGYVESVDRTFSQILSRKTEGSEDEIQLNTSDLDRSELVGDTLDLQAIVREELVLSLPTKPLCKADCKGICAGCGAELNEAECTCPPVVDDRWAALAALKERLSKRD